MPIPDLARRVLEIYWRQVRPFDGHELRQSTQSQARILLAANALRAAADGMRGRLGGHRCAAGTCRLYRGDRRDHAVSGPAATSSAATAPRIREIRLPSLRRLAPARPGEQIDIAIARRRDRAQTRSRAGLARLAGLLKPALEIMWVDDVRRMNKFLHAAVPDVAGHLFGRERTALNLVREPFKMPLDRIASTAVRAFRRTIPSITCCRGRWWGSTDWPISCWPVRGATATRVGRCRRSESWTESWTGTNRCWRTSRRRSSGPPNALASWPRPRNLPGTATRCTDVVWVPAHGSARHQLSAQLVEPRVIRSPTAHLPKMG